MRAHLTPPKTVDQEIIDFITMARRDYLPDASTWPVEQKGPRQGTRSLALWMEDEENIGKLS